ncbi:MAG: indole-3-glycerol phosphate synthase TrpC [Deltaproteobacteria bacterium]|nr:indole-3-glycerol phosphate synthase TrpC [Deltaproteobacteria bacterium]
MNTVLDKIISYKKEELASLKRKVTLQDVRLKAADAKPALDFLVPFKTEGIHIIAEIKKASPSAGVIREDFNPVLLAQNLEEAGAASLSVLTDQKFFQGSLEHLSRVKSAVKIPCLRKDFTLDEYHLFEARGAGADAVLLIVSVLDSIQLKDFQALAAELGMTALIEVHDGDELKNALVISPKLIGVNNRNLKTFKTDIETSVKLAASIPQSVTKISESGLEAREDLEKLRQAGYQGFLIGETLMKAKDPAEKLIELCHPER